MKPLPLADARRLISVSRPGQAAAAVLAGLAVLLTLAFLLASRDSHSHTLVPLKANADTVLVLDVSASISSDTYSRIGGTLRTLSRSGRKFGLVVFSDEAYEALPPGTPAADLAPLVRYFTLPPQKTPGFAADVPGQPWQRRFTAGTNISAGLELAHTIALEGSRHATVVLVSDLDEIAGRSHRLASVLLAYGRDAVPIRIVGLNPAPADVAFFRAATSRQDSGRRRADARSVAPARRRRRSRGCSSRSPAAAAALALCCAAWHGDSTGAPRERLADRGRRTARRGRGRGDAARGRRALMAARARARRRRLCRDPVPRDVGAVDAPRRHRRQTCSRPARSLATAARSGCTARRPDCSSGSTTPRRRGRAGARRRTRSLAPHAIRPLRGVAGPDTARRSRRSAPRRQGGRSTQVDDAKLDFQSAIRGRPGQRRREIRPRASASSDGCHRKSRRARPGGAGERAGSQGRGRGGGGNGY